MEACLDQDFGTHALLVMTPPLLREQLPSTVRLYPSSWQGRGTDSQPSSSAAERNADDTLCNEGKAHFLSPASAVAWQRKPPWLLSGAQAVASSPQKPLVPVAVLRRFPFSSALRRMCVLGKAPGNSPVEAFMKGAPETVASLCKSESGLCPCPQLSPHLALAAVQFVLF